MSVDLQAEIPLENVYWTGPTDITEQQIKNMAASILIHSLIEPIIVCPHDEKGQYRGVIGRLRYEAMKYRWRGEPEGKTILARVHRFKDESEILMWQLAENLHRREVTAMLKAKQYRALYDFLREKYGEEATLGTLVTAIEESTGNPESVKTVQHYLSLTKLELKTQEVLTSEKLPLRAGLELLRIEDPKRQVKAAEEIQKMPEKDRTVLDIKWRVETYITDQQRDKQRKRLNKKAEELRKKGKIVVIEAPLQRHELERTTEVPRILRRDSKGM
jgi:ParB family chromosome partitioning protein